MFDTAGQTFFAALRDAVEKRFGQDHACFRLIDRAAASGDAASIAAAQSALDDLDQSALIAAMADAHKALRENPEAIMSQWRGRGASH